MYLKLIVASVAVIAMGVLASVFLNLSHLQVANAKVPGITLVPASLGSSHMLKNWHNNLSGSIVETGALYAAGTFGPSPILLDFRRGDPRAHNGIGCFLTKGDDLIFERLNRFRTASGFVVFDMGAVRSGNEIQLVAATACTPKECLGHRLPFAERLTEQWSVKNLFRTSYVNGVVPVAVILKKKVGPEGQDATIADLHAELERVMPLINLEPARRLAAAQAD